MALHLPLLVLGLINRLSGRPLRSVFVCYPGRSSYSRRYVADWAAPVARWRLFPIGFMRQPGGMGIVFATSATERDILHRRARPHLDRLARRILQAAATLGCDTVSMSGILPSACLRQGIGAMQQQSQRAIRTTAMLALRAADAAAAANHIAAHAPLVVLGGRGAVGEQLVAACRATGRPHVVWDVRDDVAPAALDPSLPVVLVDVSRPGALGAAACRLPRGSVVVSDVYPEPDPGTVRQLRGRGIPILHLAGIRARILPSLPGAYRDVVPCCAAIDPVQSVPVLRTMDAGGSWS